MLLYDPEHITVTNYRKRRILKAIAESHDGLDNLFDRELVFLNSILTSPLHRQSKSPTLWYHRLWLLNLLIPARLRRATTEPFLVFVGTELDAVLKAGERHPKNYYSWQYARRLFSRVEELCRDEIEHLREPSYDEFLVSCAVLVKSWCCKHPSDISGWSFLLFVLPRLNPVSIRRQVVQQVLEYAMNLKVEQESLWVFLSLALAGSLPKEEREPVMQLLHTYQNDQASTDGDDTHKNRIIKTVAWITSYGHDLSIARPSSAFNAD